MVCASIWIFAAMMITKCRLRPNAFEEVCLLQKSVFGDRSGTVFPLPLSPQEAASGLSSSGHYDQRRYLWTDAFGVVNYVSQAMISSSPAEKDSNIFSAKSLLDATLLCLGNPRSESKELQSSMRKDTESSVTPHIGLRIGKVEHSIAGSDAGMRFDGMYFHYFDKILFAMLRYSEVAGDKTYLHQAVHIARTCFPFFVTKSGVHWKLNTDCSPIRTLGTPYPNHDALCGLIIYKLLNHHAGGHVLVNEIQKLSSIVESYFAQPLSRLLSGCVEDDLTLGTHLWSLQWVTADMGPNAQLYRQELLALAVPALERQLSHALSPFSDSRVRFRTYGALLGAAVIASEGTPRMQEVVSAGVEHFTSHALKKMNQNVDADADGDFKAINTVMLASSINPSAFARQPSDG